MGTPLLLTLAAVLSGAGAGALGAALTRAAYVPVLVPVALGAVLGVAVGFLGYLLVVRRRAAVSLAVALGWLACVSAFHYGEYRWSFQRVVRESYDMANDGARLMTEEQAAQASEDLLVKSVGRGGFAGFLQLRATSGVRVRSGIGAELGTPWAVFVWTLDVLLVLAVALRIALGVAGRIPRQLSGGPEAGYNPAPPDSMGRGAE